MHVVQISTLSCCRILLKEALNYASTLAEGVLLCSLLKKYVFTVKDGWLSAKHLEKRAKTIIGRKIFIRQISHTTFFAVTCKEWNRKLAVFIHFLFKFLPGDSKILSPT